MKKTSYIKTQKDVKRDDSNLEEPLKALRTVRDHEAFYFYEDIDKPTGNVARNLSDFLKNINAVAIQSLAFHLQRKDFEYWIANTLGDSKLAQRLEKIPVENNADIRIDLCKTVEERIDELKFPIILSTENNRVMSSVNS